MAEGVPPTRDRIAGMLDCNVTAIYEHARAEGWKRLDFRRAEARAAHADFIELASREEGGGGQAGESQGDGAGETGVSRADAAGGPVVDEDPLKLLRRGTALLSRRLASLLERAEKGRTAQQGGVRWARRHVAGDRNAGKRSRRNARSRKKRRAMKNSPTSTDASRNASPNSPARRRSGWSPRDIDPERVAEIGGKLVAGGAGRRSRRSGAGPRAGVRAGWSSAGAGRARRGSAPNGSTRLPMAIAAWPWAAPRRIALIGETLADVREVMVEGASGIVSVARFGRPRYEASRRRVVWENGAVAQAFSSEDPESLRGPQFFAAAWCDELAKWKNAEATFDMLQFGLRLSPGPVQLITTTPRPVPLIKRLIADKAVRKTRLLTADNADNLAPGFIKRLTRRYGGSRLGRQELDGELIEDREDALWSRAMIEGSSRCPAR